MLIAQSTVPRWLIAGASAAYLVAACWPWRGVDAALPLGSGTGFSGTARRAVPWRTRPLQRALAHLAMNAQLAGDLGGGGLVEY